jgi:CheY-like chemotaxis protein
MSKRTRYRVLVVDDTADVRESVALLLRGEGYNVDRATDGREALRCLRRGGRPALILLDLMMPRMDGWAFLREKSRDPALADIPVVILTSADDEHHEAAAVLGADSFLQKPVGADDLLGAVRRYC